MERNPPDDGVAEIFEISFLQYADILRPDVGAESGQGLRSAESNTIVAVDDELSLSDIS